MALDVSRDARRLRLFFLLAGLMLAGALVWSALRALSPEWRRHQLDFALLAPDGPTEGIVQGKNCTGDKERCTTCHLGMEIQGLDGEQIKNPLRSHPPLAGEHLDKGVGCTDCHGGTGRALDSWIAHSISGRVGRDPLLTAPHMQAACGRCHVPGATAGMSQLVSGARWYRELGCPVCHPLSPGGRGSADYGPDLRALGRQTSEYLRLSVVDPAANFPDSSMPSFGRTLNSSPQSLEELLTYLHYLTLVPPKACDLRRRPGAFVDGPCSACHAGQAGRASGRMEHRCIYIVESKSIMSCRSCHPLEIPKPGPFNGYCPAISGHRSACSACHPPSSVD